MLAPISWRVPPATLRAVGAVRVAAHRGTGRRGVDVTLFATADSITGARLVGTAPAGYSEDATLDPKVWECLHISAVFERADEFDLIHNSFDFLPLTYSGLVDTPVVTTIHGFSSARIVPVYREVQRRGYYVAISDADRHPASTTWRPSTTASTCRRSSCSPSPATTCCSSGGSIPDKGTVEAIEVAERGRYAADHRRDRPGRGVLRAVGAAAAGRRAGHVRRPGGSRGAGDLLGGARALLHLINFDEPFGFSVVEAMACGTPVIAHRRGSMSELIRHGETGFLVDSVEAAVTAVHDSQHIERPAVRREVERRFDVGRMVEDYLAVYQRIVENHGKALAATPDVR